jgi:hypothetical protein
MVKIAFVFISCIVFFQSIGSIKFENANFQGYYTWKPGDSLREDDLFCPNGCTTNPKPSECCSCYAMPCWKLNADACGVKVQELYVEYKNVLGDSTLIAKEKPYNTTLYTLTHTYGKLRYFPQNIIMQL